MKKILTILLTTLTLSLLAQAPQKFNFQAVARDNNGNALRDQSISLVTVTLSQSTSGLFYVETFTGVVTSPVGLFKLEIGTGTRSSGNINSFSDILTFR